MPVYYVKDCLGSQPYLANRLQIINIDNIMELDSELQKVLNAVTKSPYLEHPWVYTFVVAKDEGPVEIFENKFATQSNRLKSSVPVYEP